MMVVVAYDVNTQDSGGARRLRQVAKTCQKYGQRVQNSVFECLVTPADYVVLQDKLLKIMNQEKDCLRFYQLGSNYSHRIHSYGRQRSFDLEGTIMI